MEEKVGDGRDERVLTSDERCDDVSLDGTFHEKGSSWIAGGSVGLRWMVRALVPR